MKRFASYKFNLILLAIAATLLSACATTNISPQDEKITQGGWKYLGSQNYEEQSPGFGHSDKYLASFGWADVYQYDLGRKDWLNGVSDPQFDKHFWQVVGAVYFMQQKGTHQALKLDRIKDEIVGGITFRHAVLHYQMHGKNVESHVYLGGVQGRLLKFRITVRSPIKLTERESMARFVDEAVDKILKKQDKIFNIGSRAATRAAPRRPATI